VKHTPGPWKLDERVGCVAVYAGTARNCLEDPPDSFIFYRHGLKDAQEKWYVPEEQLANARVIAAAPELLEAAKWALRGLEKLAAEEAKRRGSTPELCDYTFAKALRGAILKAEVKPKIYVFPARPDPKGDCAYLAVAEDGDDLASHVSSSPSWGKRDMGVAEGCTNNHDKYCEKYPDGYDLVWVDDWNTHPFLSKQAKANKGAGPGQAEIDIP
jgi:hypothetical protein